MLLTTKKLREQLEINREVAYRPIQSKRLHSIRLGNRYYVDEKKLRDWIDKHSYKEFFL